MKKLTSDVSALTSIAESTLNKLVDLSEQCISHSVYEDKLSYTSPTEIDIGIGILYIKYEEDGVHYKFIPSKNLEKSVLKSIKNNCSPLIINLENTLKLKIENTYKDLL